MLTCHAVVQTQNQHTETAQYAITVFGKSQ
jgi:hypothetical protein